MHGVSLTVLSTNMVHDASHCTLGQDLLTLSPLLQQSLQSDPKQQNQMATNTLLVPALR